MPAVRLNSNTPCGDEAAHCWGCSHRTLVRARVRIEACHPPQTTSGRGPGPKGRAGSSDGPSRHVPTASGLIKPIAGSASEWIVKPFAVIRGNGLWEPPWGDSEAKLVPGVVYFSVVSLCNREQRDDWHQWPSIPFAWCNRCKITDTYCDCPAYRIHGRTANAREKRNFLCFPWPPILTSQYRAKRRLTNT